MPAGAELLQGRRSRARWVGIALSATLVVLTAAALFGTWRQASLLRASVDAGEETAAYRLAADLLADEIHLLQAIVADPSAESRAELHAVRPRVSAAFRELGAHVHGNEDAALERLLDLEHSVRANASLVLKYLAQEQPERAVATIEGLDPLITRIKRLAESEQTKHVGENARTVAAAEWQSRLLSTGLTLLFLVGLGVLGVTGWLSRSDRRVIEKMAAEDALTGLPNRTAFHAHAARAFGSVASEERRPTVLMLDLDGFKDVNDSLGHQVGDQLLIEVAHRLRGCVRAQDIVARLGGDEFAFLLVDGDQEAGEETAGRITAALAHAFVIQQMTLDIEASIGIATATPGQDVDAAIRDADIAMYVAKEHRLGYTRFEPTMMDGTQARATLLGSVRHALDAGEIVLHFQPKVSIQTGELLGAEALARWHHPTRGVLQPADFIPMLERTSLIHRFTADVITQALQQVRVWRERIGPIPVAVNVSTRSLLDTEFPETIAQCLLANGVPGEQLCIEITESTVVADPERAIDVLRRIRALGVRTSIDDFGTGYSAMSYLSMLPVDEVKVDKSFVKGLTLGGKDGVLTESAIELGHNLGLAVVAEGVEDQPTLRALRRLGCDVAQGFFFATPLEPADFLDWATDRNETVRPSSTTESA
jgi:diguanylate cyclase (GGDEF)-like protein